MKNVLIIEDDKDIVELLKVHLEDLECSVSWSGDGLEGLKMAKEGEFDLLILDLMLPGMNGLEICKQVRQEQNYTPILMLTAKVEEMDRILGLELGADDYLTKPFSVREFVSRVKAIFRRVDMIMDTMSSNKMKTIRFKKFEIDLESRKVVIHGNKVALTPKEFDLLSLMARNPGRSYKRDELLNLVWGYEFSGFEHTVNSHINRLRSKIEKDISNPEFILTQWGVGYRFNEEIEQL